MAKKLKWPCVICGGPITDPDRRKICSGACAAERKRRLGFERWQQIKLREREKRRQAREKEREQHKKEMAAAGTTAVPKHMERIKLLVWLTHAKNRGGIHKPNISYPELIDAWAEIKTIPLVIAQ